MKDPADLLGILDWAYARLDDTYEDLYYDFPDIANDILLILREIDTQRERLEEQLS